MTDAALPPLPMPMPDAPASRPPAATRAPTGIRAAPPSGTRDLRLDFFRGLALWFIFIDHVPDNALSWLTVRNYGFSDATEIFVFISGYTAVIAYSGIMRRDGWARATARVLGRVWQLYVAHIMLFMVVFAAVAWAAATHTRGDSFLENMNLAGFGQSPYESLLQAALLKFRPVNLDVLPLYIALLASFALSLPMVVRHPWLTLAGSVAVYFIARHLGWNLPAHPAGQTWYFNPLTWQVLFYAGAAFAALGDITRRLGRVRRWLDVAAVLYLAAAAFVTLGWYLPAVGALLPDVVGRLIYPIDKTSLDPLRVAHFLAVAWLVARATPPDAAFLRHWLAHPLRRCGEQSLMVFCLGTFLAFAGHVVVETWAEPGDHPLALDIVVSLAGLATMTVAAYYARWYKGSGAPPSSATPPRRAAA